MKRPDQHITETKSQRIFERIVPFEWVCREIKPDYGVDYLVEVFENNISTGKTFFVQLKGSAQQIKDDTFEKQITTDNLRYYNSLALPVIIICVSVKTEQIWGVWANKLIEQTFLKDNQKTLSLNLSKEYLLDEANLRLFAAQTDLINKLGISVDYDSELTACFSDHVLRWIENFYSQSVSINFNHLPKHLQLKYHLEGDSIQTSIITSSYSKTIYIKGLREDLPFLHRPKFDIADINDFNKDILMLIAVSLAKYDIQGTLKLLIELTDKFNFSDQTKWTALDPLGLLTLAESKNELHLYNRFVRGIIRSGNFEMFMFFDLAYFALSSDVLEQYRIENLEKVIEISTDDQLQGTCHYNIGNIRKSRMEINAIEHYFKAARLFPDYRNRYYWWREIAGLLFSNKHFKWAEVCYKKSLSLLEKEESDKKYFRIEKLVPKEENIVIALISDCLFLQGKFKKANIQFEKYLKSTKNTSQEWILKNMVCLELMGGKLDNIKFDRKKSIQLCEQSLHITDNKKRIEILNEATELYSTNGLAWFNLGIAQGKQQKFEDALFAFLMAGLVEDGDKEAQFNALTISFTQQKLEMMQALLLYITEKYGSSIINDLSDYIMNKNMPLEGKKDLIKAFSAMIEITKTILKKDHEFNNLKNKS